MKKYLVTLTASEREPLTALIAAGKAAAQKLAHARILLKADQADGGPAWTDEAIAEAVEVSTDTVARVRQRFVEQGLEAALVRKKQDQPSRERVLDGAAEARLLAIACSEPPDERKAWTLRMLADKLVELEVVASVSTETVRRAMKKTSSSRTGGSSGACLRVGHPGSSWPGWRTCWRCTTGRTTSGGPRCASTRCPSNWSARSAHPSRPAPGRRPGTTPSTGGRGWPTCS
jgi:hypothetical protein